MPSSESSPEPPPLIDPPHPPTLVRRYPLLPSLFAFQLASLTGLLVACIFFPHIQGDDHDGGDHILSAVALFWTFVAIILCLFLTLSEPVAYTFGWLGTRGYVSLQGIKLSAALVIVVLVLRTVFVRRKEGWRPGWRELTVSLIVGGFVVVSFVAALVYAIVLHRQGRVVSGELEDESGETDPLLRTITPNPEL